MSRKSDGVAQQNKKLRTQVMALTSLIKRIDKGTDAIRQIALVYGQHRDTCSLQRPEVEGEARVCTCQWTAAQDILKGVFSQAVKAPHSASAPAALAEAQGA